MQPVHRNINCAHWLACRSTECPLSATQWQGCFLISTNSNSLVSLDVKPCNTGTWKKVRLKSGGRHGLQNMKTHSASLCAFSLLLYPISFVCYFLHCRWGVVCHHFWGISNHPLDLQVMAEAQTGIFYPSREHTLRKKQKPQRNEMHRLYFCFHFDQSFF